MVLARATAVAALGLATLASQPCALAADAAGWIEIHGSKVRLVGGRPGPGNASYLAGLEVVLASGWKTYWRMPGDAGVPPTFDWNGSGNLERAEVLYPAPVRMPEAGGEAVGYKGAVTFPIAVNAKDAKAPVSLRLALEVGLCREICIPAMVNLSLDLLPTRSDAIPTSVAASLKRVPRQSANRQARDPELTGVRVTSTLAPARLEVEGVFRGNPASADVFVEAPDGLYVPMLKRQDGSFRFETELSADLLKELKGKTLTLTLVDDAGASEARWTFP